MAKEKVIVIDDGDEGTVDAVLAVTRRILAERAAADKSGDAQGDK